MIWIFHDPSVLSQWDIPVALQPSQVAGTLWVKAWRTERLDQALVFTWPRFDRGPVMRSPTELNRPRATGAKLRLVVRNVSPETDLLFFAATAAEPDKPLGSIHVPIRPYDTHWQEVVAHLSLDPMVPMELTGKDLTLTGMRLPDPDRTPLDITVRREKGGRLGVTIDEGKLPAECRLVGGAKVRRDRR